MNSLNYNHLYYFQVIAKEGSIKQACKVLNLTQPTLSDQLRSLEEHLGTKLFSRRNRRLILNDAGKKALKYANRIFALGNEFQRVMCQSRANESRLPIEIGIVPYLSKSFTFDLFLPIINLNIFRLKLVEGEMNHLIRDLNLGNTDVVIAASQPPSNYKNLKSVNITKSRYFAVGGPSMDFARTNFPYSLHELPFFHYTEDSPVRDDIDIYFERHKIEPRIVGEADDLNFLKIATSQNLCFSILPEAAVIDFMTHANLVILGEIKDLTSQVWAIYNKDSESVYIEEFMRSLVTHSENKKSNQLNS